jgi:hypothetical protein
MKTAADQNYAALYRITIIISVADVQQMELPPLTFSLCSGAYKNYGHIFIRFVLFESNPFYPTKGL